MLPATGVAFAFLCAPTGAATTAGATFAPTTACATGTLLQAVSAAGSYTVPAPGVITSWQFQPGSPAPPLVRLNVGRAAGAGRFTIAGESGGESADPGVVNVYPTRVPVQAGDLLGIFVGGGGAAICRGSAIGYDLATLFGPDPPVGSTTDYGTITGAQLPVAATVEPDADNDGFGDETQDLCPTDDSTQKPCPDKSAPDTIIDSGPAAKTKSKVATFTFHATEAGSTFKCSLDGKPFEPCSSEGLRGPQGPALIPGVRQGRRRQRRRLARVLPVDRQEEEEKASPPLSSPR